MVKKVLTPSDDSWIDMMVEEYLKEDISLPFHGDVVSPSSLMKMKEKQKEWEWRKKAIKKLTETEAESLIKEFGEPEKNENSDLPWDSLFGSQHRAKPAEKKPDSTVENVPDGNLPEAGSW